MQVDVGAQATVVKAVRAVVLRGAPGIAEEAVTAAVVKTLNNILYIAICFRTIQ